MAFGHSFTPSVQLVDAGIRLGWPRLWQISGSDPHWMPVQAADSAPPLRPVAHPVVELAGEIMTKAPRLRMICQSFVASIAPAQIVVGGEAVRAVGSKTGSVSPGSAGTADGMIICAILASAKAADR